MFLARIAGRVWSTAKDPALSGRKLLVLQPVAPDGKDRGRKIIAVDAVGAGAGEIVYWCRGKESSFPFLPDEIPTDAAIVGIVDAVSIAER
jgi:ethanolamine utilization protein EutN